MNSKKLSEKVAVSAQITAEDVQAIKQLGYKVIVCNRPDGESSNQANFSEIEQAAQSVNVKAIYQPVISGKIIDEDVTKFKSILAQEKGPIFAYCQSGNRSTILWSLANAGELSLDEILSAAKNAGYDMSAYADKIAQNKIAS